MPRKSVSKKVAVSKPTLANKKKISKAAAKPVVAKAKAEKKRGPKGHAMASILASLSSGPKTRQELIKAGGFSVASFYLHLKQLKHAKRILVGGRGGVIRLNKLEAVAPEASKPARSLLPALKAKPTTHLAVIPQFVSGELHDALEAVSARFVAVDRVGEKLHTLEQLSRTLPSPIAEVLMSIHEDLMKLSPARAA